MGPMVFSLDSFRVSPQRLGNSLFEGEGDLSSLTIALVETAAVVVGGLLRHATKPSGRSSTTPPGATPILAGQPCSGSCNPPPGHRREPVSPGLAVGRRQFDMHGPIAA